MRPILLAVFVLCACSTHGPDPEPTPTKTHEVLRDGTFSIIRYPNYRLLYAVEVSNVQVSVDERYVLVDTAGGHHLKMVFDRGLNLVGRESRLCDEISVSATRQEVLIVDEDALNVFELPGLSRVRSSPDPHETLLESRVLDPLPDRHGWVSLRGSDWERRQNVAVITGDALDQVRKGTTTLRRYIRGHDVDPKAGHLVFADESNRLEIYDLDKMKTVAVIPLSCKEIAWDLAVIDGVAWVATYEGTVIPVDLARRRAAAPVDVGPGKKVGLARSLSGKHLVVAAQKRKRGMKPPYPATVRLYRPEGTKLVTVATTWFDSPGVVSDLGILESTQTVVISATAVLFAWEWTK